MPTRPLANLKCDKLRISDAYCTSKSSRCAKRVMRSILGTLTCFICFSSYQLLWPWGKSHWSLCKARLPLCCIVPTLWWEALDLSQIAQPTPHTHTPHGTASSFLWAQKRKAMNSWSCSCLLPEWPRFSNWCPTWNWLWRWQRLTGRRGREIKTRCGKYVFCF